MALAALCQTVLAAGLEPAPLAITGAWVRALPPGQPNTAAYMTLTNAGQSAVIVVGASAALAQTAQFHTTREVDGYQRMEQLEQVELQPAQVLELAPGGMHLMLMGLEHMPTPGESVQLCLQLAGGGQVCAVAQVRKTADPQQSHEHHHHN